MSTQEAKQRNQTIKVTVVFPIAQGGPFKEDAPDGETVGGVRAKAMTKFGIAEDGQHRYYLTHAGAEQPDATTIEDVAGQAHAVTFTLVKELVQG